MPYRFAGNFGTLSSLRENSMLLQLKVLIVFNKKANLRQIRHFASEMQILIYLFVGFRKTGAVSRVYFDRQSVKCRSAMIFMLSDYLASVFYFLIICLTANGHHWVFHSLCPRLHWSCFHLHLAVNWLFVDWTLIIRIHKKVKKKDPDQQHWLQLIDLTSIFTWLIFCFPWLLVALFP